jgi:hypothetical protein
VGGEVERAARRALPAGLRPGSRVEDGDFVSVRLPLPELLPLPGGLSVRAGAALEGDGG